MGKITFKEYRDILMDPLSTEEEILKYSDVRKGQGAFDWELVANERLVDISSDEVELENAISIGNGVAKWKRKLAFKRRKLTGSTLPVLVSEGDSWFQFPFLIKDVVDHLGDHFLIRSLGSAGDTAHNMLADKTKIEYLNALRECREEVKGFLLSAAGNDIIGEDPITGIAALQDILNSGDGSSNVDDYINQKVLKEKLEFLRSTYQKTIANVRDESGLRNLPIFIHGYDYVFPYPYGNDKRRPKYAKFNEWLGEPLDSKGIVDTELRRKILKKLIDHLYEMLNELAGNSNHTQVWLVDCRGILNEVSDWNDEIHGTSEGFAKIADKFKSVIDEALKIKG